MFLDCARNDKTKKASATRGFSRIDEVKPDPCGHAQKEGKGKRGKREKREKGKEGEEKREKRKESRSKIC